MKSRHTIIFTMSSNECKKCKEVGKYYPQSREKWVKRK